MENTKNEQLMCYQCDIQPADPKIPSDLGICKKCFDYTAEFLLEMQEERIKLGKLDPEINEIIPGKLYLGNQDTSFLKEKMKEHGITHILVTGFGLQQKFKDDFIYKQIIINDAINQDIMPYIDECNEFIEKGKVVFVHCHAGISRSSSFVTAYIMKTQKLPFEEAYAFVKSKRSCVRANDGFKKQLKEQYQKKLGL